VDRRRVGAKTGVCGTEPRYEGRWVVRVAAKDTGGQERASRQSEELDEEVVEESSDLKERQARLSEDVEDVLDEIDEVLETDAESFVRSFVQKGGQ
jgi:ubiquitin-like protein Pup